MIEEELEKKADLYANNTIFTEYPNPSLSESLDISEEIKEAYITGAKENDVFWHDLRKNPDDLPERGHKVIAVYHDFDHTHLLAYLREDFVWTTNGHNAFDGIIAWCELPKFEVEE